MTSPNAGETGQYGRVAKKLTYAGGLAAGMERPATCSFFSPGSKLNGGVLFLIVGSAGCLRSLSLDDESDHGFVFLTAEAAVRAAADGYTLWL